MDEGQIWETFLFAAQRHLSHLITFVDKNGKQLDGTTDEICSLGDISAKFKAFGCNTIDVDNGNDCKEIYDAIARAKEETEKPTVIVLHTIKGAGIRDYETMANCHSTSVKKTDLERYYKELDDRL